MYLKGDDYYKTINWGKEVKKFSLIIVSIITVVFLVLLSFSNVIGYQSMKSMSASYSPLFSIRIQKAINKNGNDIQTFEYLGKGSENIIPFPPRNNQIYIFQEIIHMINEMNERELNTFKQIIIPYLLKEKLIQNINDNIAVNLFDQIENNSDEINQNVSKGTKDPPTRIEYCLTVPGAWNTCQSGIKCILYQIILLLGIPFVFATMFIAGMIGIIWYFVYYCLGKLTIKVCE